MSDENTIEYTLILINQSVEEGINLLPPRSSYTPYSAHIPRYHA